MRCCKRLLLSFLSIISIYVYADVDTNKAHSLTFVAGLVKPPFIIEEKNSGLQLDLIREALSQEQFDVEFIHMPLGRNITGFQRTNSDGISILPVGYKHPSIYLSEPYIRYQNVAVSLAENNFTINKVADLSNKNIIAFQNAKKFLGEEYELTTSYLMDYREVPDQQKQIELLFLRRAEVIILDINIFEYFIKSHTDSIFTKPYNIHYIFKERYYSAGFKSEEIRNAFDQGMKRIKDNGSYQMIRDSYLY